MATAIVCAYSPVGREALAGLLEAGIEVLALYTYPQGADESWFVPPAVLAGERGIPVHMEPRFNEDHVFAAIAASGSTCERIVHLASYPVDCYELVVRGADHAALREALTEVAKTCGLAKRS